MTIRPHLPNFIRTLANRLAAPVTKLVHRSRVERGRVTDEERARAKSEWWGSDDRWYPAGSPPRKHNRVTPLIDGEEFFEALAQSIEHADRYISIASWCMTPFFPLRRFSDANKEKISRLNELLALAARRGVTIRFLLWNASRYFRHPSDRMMKDMVRSIVEEIPDADVIVLFDRSARITHCIHEKAVVIDGTTAYITGMDFATLEGDRWDTQLHPLRRGPNWHDAGLKLEGEVALDVDKHFRDRYAAVEARTKIRKTTWPAPSPLRQYEEQHEAQLLTTLTHGIYPFEREGDYGIRHAYIHAIRQAKRYVYLENQYLWSPDIVDALKEAIDRNGPSDFRIVIVLPAHADAGKMDNDQHVEVLRDYDKSKKIVHVYAIYTSGVSSGFEPYRAIPVYLHSKTAVVDDEWLTIGSANLNDRGLITDVELNVAVKSPKLARELRLRLWAEHLRLTVQEIGSADPIATIDTLWHHHAEQNKQIANEGNAPLLSAIHRYETGHMPGTWLIERVEDVILEH